MNCKWKLLYSLLLFFLCSSLFAAGKAVVLDVTGAIGPATVDYIQRGIARAHTEHASLVILQINTPGGLETSMRGVNEAIVASTIPVIAFVTPSGARAASAGVFIVYASHYAYMSPGTNIGAASPVNLLSSVSSDKKPSTHELKAVNDAAAYIRSLAQLRGKNAEWGEQAVRQAASLSATEAKDKHVIDDIAEGFPQLLQKIQGKTINIQGQEQKIDTANLQLENVPKDWRFRFLSFLTDPDVAYILMLIAIYGLFFELSNPGMVLPGVVGLIALILVLYAFQLMPINYTGLALIGVGIVFMMAEVYLATFGVLGIGGVIAFILGSIMLFNEESPYYRLNWSSIAIMSALTIAFFGMVMMLTIKSFRKAVVTGQEALIGSTGVIVSIDGDDIVVRVMGELWDARSIHSLVPGQKIRVTNIEGLLLHVEPINQEDKS